MLSTRINQRGVARSRPDGAFIGPARLRRELVPLGSILCIVTQQVDQQSCGGGAARRAGDFHEYSDYETFRFTPIKPALESFMVEVMHSWRASGGEPNIARELTQLLTAAGFRVLEIIPHVRTVSPRDYTWQWPKSFIEINVARLRDLGRITPAWAADVLREFREVEADSNSWFTTPMFLEIVARRLGTQE